MPRATWNLALVSLLAVFRAGAASGTPPYAISLDTLRAGATPLVTCGDRLPLTGGAAGRTYVLPGVPDGMGLMRKDGRLVLLVNHEFVRNAGDSEGPVHSGARISELTFTDDGALQIVSARMAFDAIEGDPRVPAPATRALAKLCSAFLAGERVGFDTPIYLTGEEHTRTFDGRGGLAFALVGRKLTALPAIGRAQWENLVVLPGTGETTAIVCLEDAPADDGNGLTSQLYLYVGRKDRTAKDPTARNGLRGGKFYTWIADGAKSEADFRVKGKAMRGVWEPVSPEPNADSLEERARRKGAFAFVRIEDGAADPSHPGAFYFVTTGRPNSVNVKGRLYRLDFDVANPAGPTSLKVVLDGSEGVLSPDNIDINRHGEIAICEDPSLDPAAEKGREGSDSRTWIYVTGPEGRAPRLWPALEVNRAVVTRHFVDSGLGIAHNDVSGAWEFSGVIDAEDLLGRGAWLLNVQAHPLKATDKRVVEAGQILRMDWKP